MTRRRSDSSPFFLVQHLILTIHCDHCKLFVASSPWWERSRISANVVAGTDKCAWIRTPIIMYCTQVVTATSSVILMALMGDFTSSEALAPSGFFQRLKLAGMYSLFFFSCLLNLLDALTGRDYLPDKDKGDKKKG